MGAAGYRGSTERPRDGLRPLCNPVILPPICYSTLCRECGSVAHEIQTVIGARPEIARTTSNSSHADCTAGKCWSSRRGRGLADSLEPVEHFAQVGSSLARRVLAPHPASHQ